MPAGQNRPTYPALTGRAIAIVVGFLAVLALGNLLLHGTMMGSDMMAGHPMWSAAPAGDWSGGLMMGVGGLMMLAFWAVLFAGVILLVQAVGGQPTDAEETPLAVLKRRFAAGEITAEQYEQIRGLLIGEPAPEPR